MTEASELYEVAHTTQYATANLRRALDLYENIIAGHPDSPEAGYCRSQITNMVKQVVPDQKLLETQIQLARSHLDGVVGT